MPEYPMRIEEKVRCLTDSELNDLIDKSWSIAIMNANKRTLKFMITLSLLEEERHNRRLGYYRMIK